MRERLRAARRDTYAVYLACRDARVGWPVRLLAAAVVAYALSPIDLIPDFIPVVGYLDDLVIVPAGVIAVRSLIPRELFDEFRARANENIDASGKGRIVAAGVVITIWLVLATLVVLPFLL